MEMEGKLIKLGEDKYDLLVDFDPKVIEGYELSLSNCQAIELDYDLDELIETNFKGLRDCIADPDLSEFYIDVIKDFALELMGEKKFTEEDVKKILYLHEIYDGDNYFSDDVKNDIIQSLQQNEWEVEIKKENGCLILKRKK